MQPQFDRRAVEAFFLLVGVLLVASTLTLTRVVEPPQVRFASDNPAPLGYTWSLSLFVLPVILLSAWLARHPGFERQKKAFVLSLTLLSSLGIVLDLLFGNSFFSFPNHDATIGWMVPAVGGPIPIEEFVFYISGFLVCLLLYVWGDEYWVAAYNIPDYRAEATQAGRLVQFHAISAWIGGCLLAAAVIYKKFYSAAPEGFPWYFTYLTAASFVPSMGFYRSTRRAINWRALSFTFFLMLLVSLLWEVTLAIPYGWWGYRDEVLLGIRIDAWFGLPIEAVLVWLAVTFTTVILYEATKLWLASGKSLTEILIGRGR